MTTPLTAAPPATHRPARWQKALAAAAVASCVPYTVLKLLWLFGSEIGINDPDMVGNVVMEIANLLTLMMALCGAALAVAMVRPGGIGLPAAVVLTPMFVGAGLLGGILALLPVQALLGAPDTATQDSPDGPLAMWVYGVAYSAFAVLGICLLALSAEYAHRRWLVPNGWSAPMGTWLPAMPRRRLIAIAHGVFLVAICVAEFVVVARAGDVGGHQVMSLMMATACLAGLAAMARRRPAHRAGTVPILAAFVGAAAVASWGLFFFVMLSVPNPLADGGPSQPAALVVLEGVKAACGALTLVVIPGLRPRRGVGRAPAR